MLSILNSANACSLALHDWKLVFYLKIPVESPIVPLAEVGAALGKIPENATKQINWITGSTFFSEIAPLVIPILPDWTAKIPWQLVDATHSVMGLASKNSQDSLPLIIGSDNCFLKVAFFSDANSNFNCHQLVIQQSNRIRAVFADKSSPWAQEINGQSWVSLIFYQLPIPGRIMSFSVYPISNQRQSLYEDHPLVENLLVKRALFRRPDLVIDPFQFDFPELPE